MRLYKLEIEYDRTYFNHYKEYVSTSREGLEKIVQRILEKFPNAYHKINEYEVGEEPVLTLHIQDLIDN